MMRLTQRPAQFFVKGFMHADEKAAAVPFTTRPAFDKRVNLLSSPKIEVTDGEVCAVGDFESFSQRWQKLLVDVVEISEHRL